MKLGPISEEWARTIDCLAKLITAFAILFGGWWTVYQYLKGRADQLNTQRIEARKPLFEKRLQLYVEATSAAATVATSKDVNEVAKATEQFLRLRHGPMALVEDAKVENAMARFEACMEDKSKCESSLIDLSDKLALVCSNSSKSDFAPSAPVDLKVTAR
jgi:hypothetical protein